MKSFLPMLLIISACSHTVPSWVEGIRSGEERLKVKNGTSTLFRRIASHTDQERACKSALINAENDIRNEYGKDIPYTLEVLVYDKSHSDCAVTLSVGASNVKESINIVTPQKLVKDRSYLAEKYAITGLRKNEFEQFIKEPILNNSYYNQKCFKHFSTQEASIHGNVIVCWEYGVVAGYCKDGECHKKD